MLTGTSAVAVVDARAILTLTLCSTRYAHCIDLLYGYYSNTHTLTHPNSPLSINSIDLILRHRFGFARLSARLTRDCSLLLLLSFRVHGLFTFHFIQSRCIICPRGRFLLKFFYNVEFNFGAIFCQFKSVFVFF